MDRDTLKKMIIQLLREDEEFRYTVIGVLATILVTKEELREIIVEIKKMREDFNREMTKMRRDFNERIMAIEQRLEKMSEQILTLSKSVKSLECSIGTIGARWGVLSEETFCSALRGLLEKWFGVEVKKWECFWRGGHSVRWILVWLMLIL